MDAQQEGNEVNTSIIYLDRHVILVSTCCALQARSMHNFLSLGSGPINLMKEGAFWLKKRLTGHIPELLTRKTSAKLTGRSYQ